MNDDKVGCGCSILLWGAIIGVCAGAFSCDASKGQKELADHNAPIIKFVNDNDHRVNILHLNDTWLPNGKFPPKQAVHCVIEGINTKERKFLIISTDSESIPIPGELWQIKIAYNFAGAAYETKENPGRARIALDKKLER